MNPNSKTAIAVVFSSFKGKLGHWASTRERCIRELNTVDELVDSVRINFTIGDVVLNKMDDLCTFSQCHLRTLDEYNEEFNGRLKPWMNDISLQASAYLYIGGLQNGLLRANLIANWESIKYTSLQELQFDASMAIHSFTETIEDLFMFRLR